MKDDDEMRVAIAEACLNWTWHHGGKYCAITDCDNRTLANLLFDPLTDLNACAEMRKTMKPHERRLFIEYLFESMPPAEYMWRAYVWNLVDASARAQCRAFLQMKGKWRDE